MSEVMDRVKRAQLERALKDRMTAVLRMKDDDTREMRSAALKELIEEHGFDPYVPKPAKA